MRTTNQVRGAGQPAVVVLGLLNSASIAYAIGRAAEAAGKRVIYAFQNETLKKRYWDRDETLSASERDGIESRFCDVTDESQVAALFSGITGLSGVVHSLAYANPKTCLGPEFHTSAIDDVLKSYHVSAVSFATVARFAAPAMGSGGSLIALTFDSSRAYPSYNWMGVHKAALDAVVRALARRHGRDGVSVNAVSSGPVETSAAARIPGFDHLVNHWARISPLPWDTPSGTLAVAETVVFLLEAARRKITGQVIHVDGGASALACELTETERHPAGRES